MNLSNFESFAKCVLAPHLKDFGVMDEHAMWVTTPGRDLFVTCSCLCGWRYRLSYELMLAGRFGAVDRLADAIEEHAREVVASFHPTIAELTEWGWFDPEA